MHTKKIIIGLSAIALLFIGTLFVIQHTSEQSATTEEVVTSFYPLYYFTSRIVGDTIPVVNLVDTREPHAYEPTRADVARMLGARLVVLQGAGMESWGANMETRLKDASVPVLVLAEHLTLHESTHGAETDEHTHEEHEAEGEEDGHSHGAYDPHTWLDPVLAQDMVRVLTQSLIAIAPEQQDVYEENANKLIADLAVLDSEYRVSLASCEVREALISHASTGYLAKRYNLTFHAIAGLSTEDEPSAKLLAELANKAKEGVRGILSEQGTVTKYAEMLARETGLTLTPFNPLGRGPLTDGADYFEVMRKNLTALKTVFACTP